MNKKKNILIISALDCWSMGDGKGGPALYKTLTGYASKGWQTYFITGNNNGEVDSCINENIHIIRFDAPLLKRLIKIRKVGFFAKILWWFYFQIVAFIKAQKVCSKTEINVVYGYEIYGVPVAKILSKIRNIPMVSRFQGSVLRLIWMKKFLWQLRAWEYIIAYKVSSGSDLVIMTNDGSQGDKLMMQMGIKNDKLRFWINGLDSESFGQLPPAEEVRKSLKIFHQYVLLTVSRLIWLKRVDRSIYALSEVIKEYPDTILVIVGAGPEQGRLEQLTAELGVRENVRFEGSVPHSEIPKYLAAADIFLSFYDWSNVGNPLLEAMMAGKCIITLNNGDTGKFIRDRENGVLLDYKELAKLPEVIKELLIDEKLKNKLGANAHKIAKENFWSWEERIDAEILEVGALLLGRKDKRER